MMSIDLALATDWSQSVWAHVVVPVVAAAIVASVAVRGYLYERRNRRRDDLRALFSQALEAVAEYQELPYLVRRRGEVSPMTTAELSARISAVQIRLDFYSARLVLEEDKLGSIYSALVKVIRSESGAQISDAWRSVRLADDSDQPLGAAFSRAEGEKAKSDCLLLMQAYLQ